MNSELRTTNTDSRAIPLSDRVDQVRDRHVAAVNAGDGETAANLFAPEGVFLPPGQPPLQGIAAIRTWFTQVFSMFEVQRFVLRPGALEQHGDVAIEHGEWGATFQPKNGSPGLPAGGTYLTAYARGEDGDVRMIRDTFNGMPG